MQSRFWVSTHDTFEKAQKAKEELLLKSEGGNYQIRRGFQNGKERFRLVERLKGNEAKVVNEQHNPTGYTIRRSKKQRREREIASIL